MFAACDKPNGNNGNDDGGGGSTKGTFTLKVFQGFDIPNKRVIDYENDALSVTDFCFYYHYRTTGPYPGLYVYLGAKKICEFDNAPTGLTTAQVNEWEDWTVAPAGGKYYAILARDGHYYLFHLLKYENQGQAATYWEMTFDWKEITVTTSPDDGTFAGMSGNGTESAPWQITTAAHLKALSDYVNAKNGDKTAGKYYKLMNDIDMSAYTNWLPIGKDDAYNSTDFRGNFDGNGKQIKNLKINRADADDRNIGLFGYTHGATIKNLGVTDCNVVGNSFVGGLVGKINDRTVISNCYVTGSVTGKFSVGGLVGENWGSISKCYATCSVIGNGNFAGGLVGMSDLLATISNCYATGNVNGSENYVGGLIGMNEGAISNSYASGNVTGGGDQVGGLVGNSMSSDASIRNCVAANAQVRAASNADYINRVVGFSFFSKNSNNYANSSMTVQKGTTTVTVTNNTDEAGMGKALADMKTEAFYTTVANWYNNTGWDFTSVWKISAGNLPTLR